MGVRELLAAYAVRRAHVLVVEVPGDWILRAAAEREALRRGWRLAESPADADILAVCGVPGPELAQLVERVWAQMPGPRVRLDLRTADKLDAALDDAAARLADTPSHRQDAEQRPSSPDEGTDVQGMHDQTAEHGGMNHAGMDDKGMGGGGMGHAGMGRQGMDHDGMEPDGIPLAEGGEDRDGLEMDVLHLALGPVLRHWPAGLVLRCSLQGDVVVGAEASVVDEDAEERDEDGDVPPAHDRPGVEAAWLCENAASVLALAGWLDAATAARRARDALLEGAGDAATRRALERLDRRVRRSRLLRWSLRDVGAVRAGDLEPHGLPERLRGDVYDRLLAMLEQARTGRSSVPVNSAGPAASDGSAAAVRALPGLVTGLDLAAARLLVASLALDATRTRDRAMHG